MFGFIIGTLCLIAFFLVWRGRRWGRFGYGYCGPLGRGHFGHGPFGRGRGWLTYRAFEALDTSPGQEKAIRAALGELRTSLAELRPELDATRAELAQTLTAERLEPAAVQATLERQVGSLGRVAPVVSRVLSQIHEALDPDQRRRLARLIEAEPGYGAL